MQEFVSGTDVNNADSWALFKNVNNKLVMLPLDDHIGPSKFKLIASDPSGASNHVTLTVDVSERKSDDVIAQVSLCICPTAHLSVFMSIYLRLWVLVCLFLTVYLPVVLISLTCITSNCDLYHVEIDAL